MMLPLIGGILSRSPEDWELLHLHCNQKLRKHIIEYPRTRYGPFQYVGNISVHPYIEALNIFAGDRDESTRYAQEAQASGHPLYFNKFMDLAELAHEAGNQQGVTYGSRDLLTWEDRYGPHSWKTMCMKVRDFGIPLFDEAKKLGFDENIVRERAQILLHRSLEELEKGDQYIPSVLFHGPPHGNVKPEADEGLNWVEEARILTKYFELSAEYEYATDIMNRYLMEALCLLQNGHQWYIDLASQYGLDNAREHIEGFYATLYGKVEIKVGEGFTPASGARIEVTDPHDGRTWQTNADEEGNYEIKEVILHELCSPFKIKGEYQGETVESTYTGPLTEPNKSERHEKNLTFDWKLEMEIRWSGGCVSFGQQIKRYPLSLKNRKDPQTVEWRGKVSNSCSWDDQGYKCEIQTRADFSIKGELLDKGEKKLNLTFEWNGVEVVTFERFESKDSYPVGGKILTEIPFKPGDFGVTLIEGARGVTAHPLKPEQYKRSLGAGGNYTIGNWAILTIKK